jgi:cell division protein FtsI/penicillin-binding protein 2
MSKGFASTNRVALIAVGLFAGFAALGARLVWLHVFSREELLGSIAKARQQLIVEEARRGDILDARGGVLATSRSMIVLGVDPSALRPQDESKWSRLAELIGMPEAELERIFRTKYARTKAEVAAAETGGLKLPRIGSPAEPEPAVDAAGDEEESKGPRLIQYAKLKENIPDTLYDQIEKLGIKGLVADRVYRRVYPSNQLASHIIGYVNREQQPVAGMEAYADFYLRGQRGWRVGERDGRGRELAQFGSRQVDRADGYNVMLSIDAAVQDIVEQELAYIGTRFQPLKATIIVSDPKTGFILGLGNYPTFNLNEFNQVPKDEAQRMRNVAVADIYEPGSVFKIVAASGALEEGLTRPNEVFDCAIDKLTYASRSLGTESVLKLPAEDHHMGNLTVAEIIAHSSNKGAAQLGMRLGEEKLYQYARAFGFGRTHGFPVGGEVGGILRPWKDWNRVDITRIPMGHTIAATALQMHQAMSVIANDGVLMRPQVIRGITDATGARVFAYDGVEVGRAVSAQTARTMAAMLMAVATKAGTAPEAAIAGFEVAGKTGTTQKLVEEPTANGGKKLVYSKKHHVASFVGFFPATNPRVVISVIVDDADAHAPGGVAYGKSVAAPSFKKIGEKLIPILSIRAPSTSVRANALAANVGREKR